jgi:hypothetical protein
MIWSREGCQDVGISKDHTLQEKQVGKREDYNGRNIERQVGDLSDGYTPHVSLYMTHVIRIRHSEKADGTGKPRQGNEESRFLTLS